jgi:hypothetical protein
MVSHVHLDEMVGIMGVSSDVSSDVSPILRDTFTKHVHGFSASTGFAQVAFAPIAFAFLPCQAKGAIVKTWDQWAMVH